MDISRLKTLCDTDFDVENLCIVAHQHNTIVKKTVRSKGQCITQRFFYIIGGRAEFVLNNKQIISAHSGDMLYFPPDVTYECTWDESDDSAAISVQFSLKNLGKELTLGNRIFVVFHDKYHIYFNMLNTLVNHYKSGCIGYKIKCRSVFLDMLNSILLELIKTTQKKNVGSIYKGIMYIENNYMHDIAVDKISDMCSMCPSSFRKHFKEIIGMSPIKYKNYLMIKKAAELLKTGEFSVSETAYELGFDDLYYFNKLFKQQYFISPGKYANLHLQK